MYKGGVKMNLSNEIKSLLELKGMKKIELQRVLNLAHPQTMSTKFSRNSWSAEDLAKVANFLDGQLILKVADREIEITQAHFE